ncbi:MurR/RpiR family transcriptional regulator [Verminephrobacter aporrectodeae]|uniref:MurR/RpiR family transcriptional regulator n=1 Tax=Verminephrobacter aporrectodeae TaxID=1110389 RepID=UPI002243BE21|nr:MurR/RpiR family transcriptional regulator [Verminephrobacter aporrectodeae]MCW8174370.1 MurR/RpiR family transcriptional regulator [Verminephrobacter aporrectodeae subsp. tuberculatae]MCW8202085.1 MurR/RpiR family transcriptional regulator [Verminephrobacter aporrectodeae subsp. tuberculatae]MCW8207392.1 MurR/RpiR family transcriptional regulator [Verminephrobacter aporrectodeae subsp. tuberculatae]
MARPTPQPPASTTMFETPAMQRIIRLYPSLSRAQQRIADHVLHHVFDVATASIEELAQATGVSVATANRFARTIGHEGYPEFRADLLQTFKAALEPVEKLRARQTGALAHDTLATVMAQSADNLEATARMLSAHTCEQLVRALRQAERVYIVGFGGSAFLASSALHHLDPHCRNAHLIGGEGGGEQAVRRMNKLRAKDLVLGISFPRYSADTVRLIDFAQQRGALVAALTDGPASPLVGFAQHVLYVKADSTLLSHSNVAALAVIEGLGVALAQEHPDALAQARDLTGQLMPYLYFERATAPRARSAARAKRKP